MAKAVGKASTSSFLAPSLVMAGAGLGGTLLTNRAMKKEAGKNRNYQTYMASAKYPLMMKGMRQAQLNPYAFTGNAGSTPSGSMASGLQNPLQAGIGAIGQLANIRQSLAQSHLIDAQALNTNASTAKTIVDTKKSHEETTKTNFWNRIKAPFVNLSDSIMDDINFFGNPVNYKSWIKASKGQNPAQKQNFYRR